MLLIEIGKNLAKEFIESGRDIFTMATDVEGREVVVTVKFAPRSQQSNQTLIQRMYNHDILESGDGKKETTIPFGRSLPRPD